ncbi:MAG: PEGA domain-containing protein [Pseudomonadota bacterium]
MDEFEPKQFGKYYLLEKLAVGGMAEIYKAKTFGVDGFEKELAIKRILPHCSADKDFITMLIDEAKLSVMLSHANIVQVYDLGKVHDDYFISMEFIHGVNLRDLMYRCREDKVQMSVDLAVYVISEICKGLDYAHRKTDPHDNKPLNIVHRDISPQNVLLSYEGEVKIVDFGIAKAAMNISHTMAGILKGKIAYMSPEQAMGKSIDRRTDIFSTGILLYELIAGQKLYTGESQFEVLKKIRTTRITPETLPNTIPAPLKPIVAKALAYDIDARFQFAGDLQIELTKFLYSTYSDFSPRKLAAFIHEVFTREVGGEQVKSAREAAVEQQTSSMSLNERAKQLEIVHRESSFPQVGDTARAKGPGEALLQTMMSPADRRAAPPAAGEADTDRRRVRKKGRGIFKALAAMMILAAGLYAAQRFVPELRFWEKFLPVAPVVNATAGNASVTSEPPGAQIILNGAATGKTTPAILEGLAAGREHTIRAEMENFGPAEKRVAITGGALVEVALKLIEPKGMLNIITDPPGAAIMIEGRLTGLNTPAALENLPLGKDQRITLSKPDYEDFEQVVNLTTTKPQKISTHLKSIVPQSGKLMITSTPAGAAVWINGKDIGRTTPATIANLEPKKYVIQLAMNGYDGWSGNLDVGADQTVPVDALLMKTAAPPALPPPATPPLTPPTTPPLTPPTTPPVVEKPVTAPPAAPTEAEKAATAGKGSLRVTSNPAGAAVLLNGGSTGRRTPAVIEDLKIGSSYNIRFDLEGYKSVTRKKSIQKPSDTLYAELSKEEQKAPPPETPRIETPPPAETPKPAKIEPVKPEPAKPEPETAAKGGTGTIRVASNPSGADVFINSELKGRTPITVTVPSGTVSVLINKEGAARVSRQVTVKPGQTVNLTDINLGDLYGEVSLSSDPPRAQVIFDGQAIPAPTPVTVRRVRRDQQHSVTIQLPGYRSWSKSFSMDEGNKSFSATLQQQ